MIVKLLLLFTNIMAFAQDSDSTDSSGTVVNATNIFQNLMQSYAGITNFLTGFMYLLGIGLTVSAVLKFKKFGHRTAFMHIEAGMLGPAIQFMIGVTFLYAPSLLEILNYTLFREGDISSVMTYTSENMTSDWQQVMNPILGMVQIIGLIAFIRGFLILSKSVHKDGGNQPGQVSKGIVHICGGVLGINVVQTINVVNATFGLN